MLLITFCIIVFIILCYIFRIGIFCVLRRRYTTESFNNVEENKVSVNKSVLEMLDELASKLLVTVKEDLLSKTDDMFKKGKEIKSVATNNIDNVDKLMNHTQKLMSKIQKIHYWTNMKKKSDNVEELQDMFGILNALSSELEAEEKMFSSTDIVKDIKNKNKNIIDIAESSFSEENEEKYKEYRSKTKEKLNKFSDLKSNLFE